MTDNVRFPLSTSFKRMVLQNFVHSISSLELIERICSSHSIFLPLKIDISYHYLVYPLSDIILDNVILFSVLVYHIFYEMTYGNPPLVDYNLSGL